MNGIRQYRVLPAHASHCPPNSFLSTLSSFATLRIKFPVLNMQYAKLASTTTLPAMVPHKPDSTKYDPGLASSAKLPAMRSSQPV